MHAQRTIERSVTTTGIGVHTAGNVILTMYPAPPNTGIVFIRSDVPGRPHIPAKPENVSSTLLSTSLSKAGISVSCVEHLMSALWSQGIDNLYIEIDSEEVPIMDGSAAPFIFLIKQAGIQHQSVARQYIKILEDIEIEDGDTLGSLTPFDGFRAAYTFVFDHPVFNRYPKHIDIDFCATSFTSEVSRARTFGLVKELDQAQAAQKCLGSSLENAIGVDDFSILNHEGLRYDDEFVKHKLLDAIGDLYLLGNPILGSFSGIRSGHTLNNKLALALLNSPSRWELTEQAPHPVQDIAGGLTPIAA